MISTLRPMLEWSFVSFDPVLLSVHFYIYFPELYFINLLQICFLPFTFSCIPRISSQWRERSHFKWMKALTRKESQNMFIWQESSQLNLYHFSHLFYLTSRFLMDCCMRKNMPYTSVNTILPTGRVPVSVILFPSKPTEMS